MIVNILVRKVWRVLGCSNEGAPSGSMRLPHLFEGPDVLPPHQSWCTTPREPLRFFLHSQVDSVGGAVVAVAGKVADGVVVRVGRGGIESRELQGLIRRV